MPALRINSRQEYTENKASFDPFEPKNEWETAMQKNYSDVLSPDEIYQCFQTIINNGNDNVAIWILQKLVEFYPDYAIAHNDLGVLYYNRGDQETALNHYEKAAQLKPENITFQKNLADFYYVEQGRVEDALKIYVEVLTSHPEDLDVLLVTGHLCAALSRFEDAKVFYKRILEIEPWNSEAKENLEKLENNKKSIPGLSANFQKNNNHMQYPENMECSEKTPEELYENAQSVVSTGQGSDAIRALEDLLKFYPDYAIAHNDLGVLYYNAGNKETALNHYEKAAQLQPENKIFQKNLADFYYVELHRVEDAMRIYLKVLENDPADIESLLITGHLCVSLNKFEDAVIFYNCVLEIEPWNLDARENLDKLEGKRNVSIDDVADVLGNENMHQSQTGNFSAGVTPEKMFENAQAMVSAGDTEGAIEVLEGLVKKCPDNAIAHNDLGVLCYKRGDKEKALTHYEKAVQLQPVNTTFQKNLADFTYVVMCRAEDAMKIYVRVLEKAPDDVETLLSCGRLCADYHQIDDAKIFYNRVLNIEPWNSDASESLDNLDQG